VLCRCCTTSPYLERCGGIGSGETLSHDIYPARPITIVSLAANTYCMMDGFSSSAPRTMGSRVQFSDACEQSHWWPARHTADQKAIWYQWFKQRLILSVSKPSISQRSQVKEDTVEPSVPAGEVNLKAYAAITWHNDRASWDLEPRLADHRSQAARTATLPTVPLGQASFLDRAIKFCTTFCQNPATDVQNTVKWSS